MSPRRIGPIAAGRRLPIPALLLAVVLGLGGPGCGRYGPPTRRPPEPSAEERAPARADDASERRPAPTAVPPTPASESAAESIER